MFLELGAELVDLSWTVGGIVGETRKFVGVRTVLWACGGEGGPGRVAGGDKGHVIGSEDVHEKEAKEEKETMVVMLCIVGTIRFPLQALQTRPSQTQLDPPRPP